MCNPSCTDRLECVSGISLFLARFFWVVLVAGSLARFTPAQSRDVLTYRYDNTRLGLNQNETILTPSNVNATQFGKLFSQSVDGEIYPQPLYVSNLNIPGKGSHNVVFVATENDSVYAFDADSKTGANANPLWQATMLDAAHGAAPGATAVAETLFNCTSVRPLYGIAETPVIDRSSGTMYLEAMSMENGSVVHRLHALDITTGAEKAAGPVLISPSAAGTGDGSVNGKITFDSMTQYDKMALLLLNGTVYITYGSHCDQKPEHGWLLAYDSSTLALKAAFIDTPNGRYGGIWMSGGGAAVDPSGNIYLTTGNGTFDGIAEFGDSVMKFDVSKVNSGTFSILDYFTPFNQAALQTQDLDQGAGGIIILPDLPASGNLPTHLLVTGGKDGSIYLLDRDNLGHFNSSSNQVWQSFPNALPAIFSTPAYWNNNVYISGAGTHAGTSANMEAYQFDPVTRKLSGTPTSKTSQTFSFPAPNPVVSSNGNTNGIVWAMASGVAYYNGTSGTLHAYDATNLAHELYNSSQNKTRDDPGLALKFVVPVVMNGKVYVGSQTQINVYGLFNPGLVAPSITSANSTAFAVGVHGSFTVTATGNPAPTFSESGALPSGVTFTSAGVLSGTPGPGTSGNYPIVITAQNGVAPNATQNFTLTIGQAPTITSASSTTFTVGTTGNFTVTATGTPTPTFSESGALPSGVTLNSSTGVLSGKPATGTGGNYAITITAQNGVPPNATQNFTLTVDEAPAITSANSTTFPVGAASNFTVKASGTPAPTFSESGALPSGVTFSSAGVLSGTPAAGTQGSYPITITAQNGIAPNATQNFTLTVNQAPVITSANNTTFTVGSAGNFTVTATGSPAPTFSESGALPNGVTFSSAGVLSGTPGPGKGGNYAITITAQNGVLPNGTQNFTLTVDQAPAITSANNTAFTVGTLGSFTVTATGFPTPTISESGPLPSGVTFNTSTHVLSGTPAAGTANNYPITFTAHNGIGADSVQNFTLTVKAQAASNVAFVRAAGRSASSGSYTVTLSPTTGDFLTVFVWQEEGAGTPTVTDNLASAYTKDCDFTYDQGFGLRRLTVFHVLKAGAGITGVKVTPNKPSRTIVAEYSGMASTASLDVCGTVNNQNTNVTSWSSMPTTTTGTDLIFGLADTGLSGNAGYAASGAWNGRFTEHDTADWDDSFVEDQLNMAPNTYTATGTTTASVREGSVVVAYKVQ
jgi:hypothetical protein